MFILPLVAMTAYGQSNGNGNARGVGKGLDKQVERQVARGVEKNVEKQVGRNAEKQVDRNVSQQVASKVSKKADTSVSKTVNANASSRATEKANNSAKNNMEKTLPDAAIANSNRDKTKTNKGQEKKAEKAVPHQEDSTPAAEFVDFAVDDDGSRYLRNQRVLLVSPEKLQELQRNGVTFRKTTQLSSMKKILVELDAENAEVASGISRKYRKAVALNYVYSYQDGGPATASPQGWLPNEALPLNVPPDQQRKLRIGMVDSTVNTQHSSLRRASITSESFVAEGLATPQTHGTAVASVLSGDDAMFIGLLPDASLYSAGVFYSSPEGSDTASLTSIVLALDWLVAQQVDVINMSLAGPGSMLLEDFVNAASARGIAVVAAAGNGGPGAKPAYPAAYPSVVAVTAVDENNRVYYRASHGDYIDFAAPGVNIASAASNGGYRNVSGTSYAAPFVSAVVAGGLSKLQPKALLKELRKHAQDLGEPKRDLVYGYGKVRPINEDRLVYSE